jgi:hypothetical protein
VKFRNALLATVASAGLAAYAVPARADTICPAVEFGTGCALVFTFNNDGSITTTAGTSPGPYDDSDDTLIGVVNNSGHALLSFNLTSSQDIFGFDGDGIDPKGGLSPVAGNPDTTGYGGPDAYYTNIVGTNYSSNQSGTVNFANGGIQDGGTDYFSLEEPITLTGAPTVTAAPEPATLAVLGVGMFGAGIARRFRRKV